MWLTAGLLLAVSLPATAQRLVAEAGGTLNWSGDQRTAPYNQPGEIRVGSSDSGFERGYMIFTPPSAGFGLGRGPVRLYVYVLDFPAADRGELSLTAYTVAPRFPGRDDSAERSQEGGYLWQRLSEGSILAVGEGSALGRLASRGDQGGFWWGNVSADAARLDAPAAGPGWHYLELDPAASDAVRRVVDQAQRQGSLVRLGLLSRDLGGELILGGAGDLNQEPTLELGPTYEVDLRGEGRVRVNGVDCELPFRADLPAGERLTLEAICPPGGQFLGWSGDRSDASPRITLPLDGPLQLSPRYRTDSYRLQVWSAGGRVTGGDLSGDGGWSRSYSYGAHVRLYADPDPGYRFVGWEGDYQSNDPYLDAYLDRDCEVWARFERISIDRGVTLRVDGWGGFVLVNGCPAPLPWCGDFGWGDPVHLTAIPCDGYRFVGWQGDGWGAGRSLYLRLDGSRSVRAVFERCWEIGWSIGWYAPRCGYRPPTWRWHDNDWHNWGRDWGRHDGDGRDHEGDWRDHQGDGGHGDNGHRPPPPPGDRPGDHNPPRGGLPGNYDPPRGGLQGEYNPPRAGRNDPPAATRPPDGDQPRRGAGYNQNPNPRPPQVQGPVQNEQPRRGVDKNQNPSPRPPQVQPPVQSDQPRRGAGGNQAQAPRPPQAPPVAQAPRAPADTPARGAQDQPRQDQPRQTQPRQTQPRQAQPQPRPAPPPAARPQPPAQAPTVSDPPRRGGGSPSPAPRPPAAQPQPRAPREPAVRERPQAPAERHAPAERAPAARERRQAPADSPTPAREKPARVEKPADDSPSDGGGTRRGGGSSGGGGRRQRG
jgi:hypothetical protein